MAKKTKKVQLFYAVRRGHHPGIYSNLVECEAACRGFPGEEFKGFATLSKAQLYMKSANNIVIEPKKDYLQTFLETDTDLKDESSTYHAVARGKQPGVYTNRFKALEQTANIGDSKHKGFDNLKDAMAYVREHGSLSEKDEVLIFQSHFDNPQFRGLGFQHQPEASFDDNFNQLAASQGWTSDSNTLREQKALVMNEEFRSQFFPSIKEEDGTQLTEEESKLKGYQNLCRSVRKPEHETIAACVDELSNRPPWVNIKDLIDARRQRVQVQTFMDWRKFVKYTSKPGKRIDVKFAKEHEDLKPFLQRLSKGPPRPSLLSNQLRTSPEAKSVYPTPEIKLEPIPESIHDYRPTLLSQYDEDMENLVEKDFKEESEDNPTHSEIGNNSEDSPTDSKYNEEILEWDMDIMLGDEESNSRIKIYSEECSQLDPLMVDGHVENTNDDSDILGSISNEAIRDRLTADQEATNFIFDLLEDTLQPRMHTPEIKSNSLETAGTKSLKRKRRLSKKELEEDTLTISTTDCLKERPRKRGRTKKPSVPVVHEAGGLVQKCNPGWSNSNSGRVSVDTLQEMYKQAGAGVSDNLLRAILAGPKKESEVLQKNQQALIIGTEKPKKKKKKNKKGNKKKRHPSSKK